MDYQSFLIVLPMLMFSVVAHEYAHGYAALKQGDTTALDLGRLTFNPIKHIDLKLTILMPLFLWYVTKGQMVLGGAKPVPVNPNNYREYRRGDIIVSLAGVATNFLVAIGCTILVPVLGLLGRTLPSIAGPVGILQAMMLYGILLNFVLILFNLIPIPPLDGSHVVKHFLPAALAVRYERFGQYGFIILIALMYLNVGFLRLWMKPALVGFSLLGGLVEPTVLPEGAAWFGRVAGR